VLEGMAHKAGRRALTRWSCINQRCEDNRDMKIQAIVAVVSMVIVTHAFAAEQTWTGATSDKMLRG
jgi:hypothetical protein